MRISDWSSDVCSSDLSYFLGLGIGSLFYGSLSDRYGRKPVLLVTLALYPLSTLFCALAQSFPMMLGGRAAAGFFAAATRVVAISIVRSEGGRVGKEGVGPVRSRWSPDR